jgi:hypothetical protein
MIIIPIKNKKHGEQLVFIDGEDFNKLKNRGWCARHDKHSGKFYVVARSKKVEGDKLLYLHREITQCEKDIMVDHIDGNPLNNCRNNLRACNKSTNGMNRSVQKNKKSSIYKGCFFIPKRNKYRCCIGINNKNKFIGYFEKEEDAAIAYNNAAILYHGEFAKLNIIIKKD